MLRFLAICAFQAVSAFRHVADVKFPHAAVCSFDQHFPGSKGPALLMASFYPTGKDEVAVITNIADMLQGGAGELQYIDQDASWPNQADPVPNQAIKSFPHNQYVLSSSGFFVSPTKWTGSVTLYDVTKFPTVAATVLSTPKSGHFYHEAEWLDMNGDGLLDVVAARAYKSVNPFAKAEGELTWMEQPAKWVEGEPWVQRQITGPNGPGVAFALTDLDNDGTPEVVAAQFFTAQQLSIWSCQAKTWSGCENGTNVEVVVIDDQEGAPFFNVEWVDLNGDGRKDLLATTNTANGNGAVLAFEQPAKWQTQPWTKHVLASGYKPGRAWLPGRGAPGKASTFFATKSEKLPCILVSADDAGYVDLLVPDGTAFSYSKTRVVNSTNTIGTLAILDVDGDGYVEVAVPLWAENRMALYTFAPEE